MNFFLYMIRNFLIEFGLVFYICLIGLWLLWNYEIIVVMVISGI